MQSWHNLGQQVQWTQPPAKTCVLRSVSRSVTCVQDNLLHGSFLAELTKEVLTDLEASKYQHAEYRISIYGRKRVEWDILAAWIVQNQLYSDNVVWLIQVWPLGYHLQCPIVSRKKGKCTQTGM